MTRPPSSVCERIFAGETPLKAWADYRDMDPSDLRSPTITVHRIEQLMEGKGRKMGEAEERHFARVLDISRIDLRGQSFVGCSSLADLDEEEILSRDE